MTPLLPSGVTRLESYGNRLTRSTWRLKNLTGLFSINQSEIVVTMAGISSPSSSVQASGAADPTRCKTIREAVDLFMAEKKAVLKPKTYCKYDMVMSLFIFCMNRYGWNEIQEKYDGSIEFIDKFKPSLIAECVGEFLSYFMVR